MKRISFFLLALVLVLAANRCDAAIITVLANGGVTFVPGELNVDLQVGDPYSLALTIDSMLLPAQIPASTVFINDAITSVSLFGPSGTEFESVAFAAENRIALRTGAINFVATVPASTFPFNSDFFYNRIVVAFTGLNLDPNAIDVAQEIADGLNGVGPHVDIFTTRSDGSQNATFQLGRATTGSTVVVTAVPEPSSFALIGCVCTVAVFRRKRRTRSMN